MSVIDLEGVKIYYASSGTGAKSVVFLHGMNCSWRNWQRAMAALPGDYRSFALDLNRSGQPKEGFIHPDLADTVSRFIEVLSLGKVTLVGHSFGGLLALHFALGHPDQLERLVLVNTGASTKGHKLINESILHKIKATPKSREFMESLVGSFFYRKPPEPEFKLYIDDAMRNRKKYMLQGIGYSLGVGLEEELKNVKAKTLVVYGIKDPIRRVEHAQTLKDGIPGSRLVIIEESGHLPMVEQPDQFNAALLDFLTG